jgi:ADP-heptose:LPS heptosyltransferase
MRGPEPLKVNLYLKGGGLGDNVARLPAVKYLLDHAPNVTHATVIVPRYFIEFAEHLLEPYGERVTILPEEDATAKADFSLYSPTTDEGVHSTLRTHLTDHAFHTLVDASVDDRFKNYLQIRPNEIDVSSFNLPERYVVLTTGFTAPVREWLPEQINAVIDWLSLHNISIVFLGKERVSKDIYGNFDKDAIQYDRGINLINKTTLLEAAKIMGQARAVVGLDNGLLHVAGCTGVPIVAGYSSVEPKLRMPYRMGRLGHEVRTVTPDTPCQFNQSSTLISLNYDFRQCVCGDYRCLKSMTSRKWIYQLYETLK